jgi:hypothetical protein
VYVKMFAEEKETIQQKLAEINEVGAGIKETLPPSSPPIIANI